MKVLMFGWEFPPHISGGLGTACYGLTKGLSGFGDVEVILVVPKSWGDEDRTNVSLLGANEVPVIRKILQFEDVKSKVEYYELRSELIPYLGSAEFNELKSKISSGEKRLLETTSEGKLIFEGGYGLNLLQEIQNFALVAETLARQLEFDVIHVNDWMTFPAGVAAKRISGKPLVVHIHSTEFDRSGLNVNPTICAAEKLGMDAADRIVAVSNLTREIIVRNYHVSPEKVVTVYNAVEPFAQNVNQRPTQADRLKTVSFLGRITAQKGPGYFIEAASLVLQKIENVRFVMAGKGDLREAMINRADELNISDCLYFPGFLKDEEVGELFQMTDVFVMPSVSEPFGIVALEAMQSGIPVIISKQSGVSEIVKNVIKVDYWDIHSMAEAISNLLENQTLADRIRKKGKKEADKLFWKNSAGKIREIYLGLQKKSASKN